MTQRISKRTVNQLFYRYSALVNKQQKRLVNLGMQEGSESAGVAWKVYNMDNGNVYLRMTTSTREAYLMLSAAIQTLESL